LQARLRRALQARLRRALQVRLLRVQARLEPARA